jgi:hypothetical protein
MDAETRAYLDEMRQEIREDIRALGETLGAEIREGDAETRRVLRDEIQRGDAETRRVLRAEILQRDLETRNALGALIEAQRRDLAAVAEMVAASTEAIELQGLEMRDRFEAVRIAFIGVRRDIAELRARS